jgi:hypothetical protein
MTLVLSNDDQVLQYCIIIQFALEIVQYQVILRYLHAILGLYEVIEIVFFV